MQTPAQHSIPLQWRLKSFADLTPSELYAILSLRERVFIVEQNCAYADCDGRVELAHHLMGWSTDKKLVAYSRLLPQHTRFEEVSIGRAVVAAEHRGQQLGRALMVKAMKAIEELYGARPIRISAQSYLLRFYQSLGFKEQGSEYLEDAIPHYEMIHLGSSL
jgi:ElaA protein